MGIVERCWLALEAVMYKSYNKFYSKNAFLLAARHLKQFKSLHCKNITNEIQLQKSTEIQSICVAFRVGARVQRARQLKCSDRSSRSPAGLVISVENC